MSKYTDRICDIKEELLLITEADSIEVAEFLLKRLDMAIRIHEKVLFTEQLKNAT